jgi:hypothetical protein
MLHSLPALLDELKRRLIVGEDPLPLLGSIKWPEVIDWPKEPKAAQDLKHRLAGLQELVRGLQAPLRATWLELNPGASYENLGGIKQPRTISYRFHQNV